MKSVFLTVPSKQESPAFVHNAGTCHEGGDTEPLPLPGLNGHDTPEVAVNTGQDEEALPLPTYSFGPAPESDVAANYAGQGQVAANMEEGLPLPQWEFARPADAPVPERGVRGHRTTGVRNIVEDEALPLPTYNFKQDEHE